MKKIGIITLYYKNNNYGGVAQAYALNKYFQNLGFDSELITYKKEKSTLKLFDKNRNIKSFIKRITNKLKKIIIEIVESCHKKKYSSKLKAREEKLEDFRNKIPHSKLYTKDNIFEIENSYDFFVTGSDQCWHPGVIVGSFVFDFLEKKKKKIFSYASSIAVDEFTNNYITYMKHQLKKYKSISVREENSRFLLEKAIGKTVELVLDPTLLLTKQEWDSITSDRLIKEKYAFAYILGDEKKQRTVTKKIAKEKRLKLITLPFIKNGVNFTFKLSDYNFGDEQMLDINFGDFLSLIKYADLIITDSFHAVCFSSIFQKEFIAIDKGERISTTSRIKSLLDIMGEPNRIISYNTNNFDFDKINYEEVEKNLKCRRSTSEKYIKRALDIK